MAASFLDRNAAKSLRLRRNAQRFRKQPTGSGTVTSVAIAQSGGILSVSGSPVTTAGTITLGFANEAANLVLAGPTSGGAAAPTFRALVTADLPAGTLTTTNFVFNETPSGTVNGSNPTFTLANTPTTGTVRVYVNGLRQHVGAGNDYTISGSTITFLTGSIPLTGDVILCDYLK